MGQFTTTRTRKGDTAVTQATVPWVVEGFSGMTALTVTVSGTSAVTQSTSPWIVAGGGTAGAAASGVVTVQGIASMTPLTVTLASTTVTGTVAVTQSTSPWIVAGGGTAGVPGTAVLTVQGVAAMTPLLVTATLASTTITGTVAVTQSTTPWAVSDNSGSLTVDAPVATPVFVRLSDGAAAITTLAVSLATVPTHAVTIALGGVASGAIASGAVASGAFASGALASGSVASGAIAAGAIASGAAVSGAFADGAIVTLGAKADAKSTATDTTAITLMQVAKQISASVQAIDTGVPAALGQTTMSASMPVVLASDQSALALSGTITATPATSATATLTNVAASATSVQLLASTAGRKQATFFNDSAAVLYLKFGTTASATSFTVRLTSNAYYELPPTCYTGRIDGIWASATGTVRITELT